MLLLTLLTCLLHVHLNGEWRRAVCKSGSVRFSTLPSLPSLLPPGGPPLNWTGTSEERCEIPEWVRVPNDSSCILSWKSCVWWHKSNSHPLNWHCTQISKISVRITDNFKIKSIQIYLTTQKQNKQTDDKWKTTSNMYENTVWRKMCWLGHQRRRPALIDAPRLHNWLTVQLNEANFHFAFNNWMHFATCTVLYTCQNY